MSQRLIFARVRRFGHAKQRSAFATPPRPRPAEPAPEEQARWFAEEVQPHEVKALRGWLRAKYPGLNDVDDLVQEAYLRLIRARAAAPVRNPKSYVFSVARNAAIDQFRRPRTVVAVTRWPAGRCFRWRRTARGRWRA